MHLQSDWLCTEARNTGVNAVPHPYGGVCTGKMFRVIGVMGIWAKMENSERI